MRMLDKDLFERLIEGASIKPRLKRELRFVTSIAHLTEENWSEQDFISITDRSGNKGVLVIELDEEFYVAAYEISRGITSSTGKAQPIICDFCRTWQTGSRSGSILFTLGRDEKRIGYLCCADLLCSQHVRNKTQAAKTSRSQLREDLDTEQRVERLHNRLKEIVDYIGFPSVSLE